MKTVVSAVERVMEDLVSRTYVKCIVGAAITAAKKIRLMTHIYTRAGASAIDVNAEGCSVDAALAGRDSALAAMAELGRKSRPPLILASVVHERDVHGLKARIDPAKCLRCGQCRRVCGDTAISPSFVVDTPHCRGCGWCYEACPTKAASLYCPEGRPPMPEAAARALDAGADAVELHVSGLDFATAESVFTACAAVVGDRLTSICLYSNRTSPATAARQVQLASRTFSGPLIFQADGAPMSGGGGDAAGLQAVAAGHLALDSVVRDNVFVQISGGVVDVTMDLARMLGLEFAGCGLGKFALQVVQPEFDRLLVRKEPCGEPTDPTLVAAVMKARRLVDRLHGARDIHPLVGESDGTLGHFVGPSAVFECN